MRIPIDTSYFGAADAETRIRETSAELVGVQARLAEAEKLLANTVGENWSQRRWAFLASTPTPPPTPEPVCTVHGYVAHGGEAEELRSGIEDLIERGGVNADDLVRLLDGIDARDSLVFSERHPARDAEPTLLERIEEEVKKAMSHANEAGPGPNFTFALGEGFVRIRDLLRSARGAR